MFKEVKAIKRVPISVICMLVLCCTNIRITDSVQLVYVFAVPIAFLWLKEKLYQPIFRNGMDWLLLAWYATYFLSVDHLVSGEDFIAVTFGQAALFLIYGYFASVENADYFKRLKTILSWALQFSVLVGVLQLFLFYSVHSQWGISHVTHGVGLPRMSGLLSEPDWYGLICMVAALFEVRALYLSTDESNASFTRKHFGILCIDLMMLLLSLTRAAWLGFLAALILMLLFKPRKKKDGNTIQKSIHSKVSGLLVIACLAVICIFAICALFNPELVDKLLTRINPLLWQTHDGGAADTRTSAIEIALRYFQCHPFTGNGVGSLNTITGNADLLASLGYYYEVNAGRGGANIIITNLFDVGIIGTLFLFLYFFILLFQLHRCYKRFGVADCLFYASVLVGLLIDFQFNNGLRLCLVWVLLGFASTELKLGYRKYSQTSMKCS